MAGGIFDEIQDNDGGDKVEGCVRVRDAVGGADVELEGGVFMAGEGDAFWVEVYAAGLVVFGDSPGEVAIAAAVVEGSAARKIPEHAEDGGAATALMPGFACPAPEVGGDFVAQGGEVQGRLCRW